LANLKNRKYESGPIELKNNVFDMRDPNFDGFRLDSRSGSKLSQKFETKQPVQMHSQNQSFVNSLMESNIQNDLQYTQPKKPRPKIRLRDVLLSPKMP
jgi:hypothetical protein